MTVLAFFFLEEVIENAPLKAKP